VLTTNILLADCEWVGVIPPPPVCACMSVSWVGLYPLLMGSVEAFVASVVLPSADDEEVNSETGAALDKLLETGVLGEPCTWIPPSINCSWGFWGGINITYLLFAF
jgi:hypothetical protein